MEASCGLASLIIPNLILLFARLESIELVDLHRPFVLLELYYYFIIAQIKSNRYLVILFCID